MVASKKIHRVSKKYLIFAGKNFNMEKVFIYALCEPETGEVRYVGKTRTPKRREREHNKTSVYSSSDLKNAWVNELHAIGAAPVFCVIEQCTKNDWQEREVHFIRHYRELGHRLLNQRKGGGGDNPYGREIVQISRDGSLVARFKSITDAEELSGVIVGGKGVLRGKNKSAGGYLWMYADVFDKMQSKEFSQWLQWANENKTETTQFKEGEVSKRRRKVYQYDGNTGRFIRAWNNVTRASLSFSKTANAVTTGIRQTGFAGGFFWSYEKHDIVPLPGKMPSKKKIPVEQLDGKTKELIKRWNNIREASETLNIGYAAIQQSIYKPVNRAGGYYWRKSV